MTKKQRLLDKITRSQKNIRFDDFVTLVVAFDFQLIRIRGSHHMFRHPTIKQKLNLQPTSNGQAKEYQVKQFLKIIEDEQLQLNSSEEVDE